MTDVNLRLAIDHDDVFDLFAVILSPDGSFVQVFSTLTSQSDLAARLQDTVIDDEAAAGPIGWNNASSPNDEAAAPWVGTYQPQEHDDLVSPQRLGDFDGKTLQGTWQLWVYDQINTRTGTLYRQGDPGAGWSQDGTALIFEYAPVPEPAEVAGLTALGLLGLAGWRRRNRNKKA